VDGEKEPLLLVTDCMRRQAEGINKTSDWIDC